MKKEIQLKDKQFQVSIRAKEIQEIIRKIANNINNDLKNEEVIFLGILNGSFMILADLMKEITIPCLVSFVKFSSYDKDKSTGKVRELIGLDENLKNKTVVVVEDIIDSGLTLDNLLITLKTYSPKKIVVTTLLFKPQAFARSFKIDYIGKEIPNDFIVGYGLDYDGFGRNYKDIYTVKK